MREIICGKAKIESGNTYSANDDHYDIALENTVHLTDKIYRSTYEDKIGYLDCAFYLKGLKNVTLDFDGAVVTLHGKIQPFIIDECENITIKNLTLEYSRSEYTEFDIVSNDADGLWLKMKDKFPCRVENGYLIPYCDTWENKDLNKRDMFLQAFDSETREGVGLYVVSIGENIVDGDTPPCHVEHLRVRESDGDIVLMGKIPQNWGAGMSVVITHEPRNKSNALLCRSKNIVIENYRVLNGAGMGIYGMYTENITIDGYKLFFDEKSHGIITNAADAIHLVACFGDVVIKNSVIEGMVDDALNVHSNFCVAKRCENNRLFAFRDKRSHCILANFKLFGQGDKIAVYNGDVLEQKAVYTVKNAVAVGEHDLCIETVETLGDIRENDLIENLSAQPALKISNCRFGKSNTHLRLQTRAASVMENCVTSLPVMLTGDTNYWYEASPINDLTIKNCVFTGQRAYVRSIPEIHSTDRFPYYHSGIKITGNRFDRAVCFEGCDTDNIVFKNNTGANNQALAISVKNCGHIDCDCDIIQK